MVEILNTLISLIGPGLIVALIFITVALNKWIFKRIKSNSDSSQVSRQTISILIILVGTLVFILSLPIDKSLKGQILSFLGIIISAAIALSSTTVLGNLIAGIMNNAMDRYKVGDLIQVGDLTGRVTKRIFFIPRYNWKIAILLRSPNLHISSNPVKLTRKANTVISTTVSLGYDVSQNVIVDCLKGAAEETGLKDPYVYITGLGDFSVTYKIHGFLEDSTKYFTMNSLLNSNVIDHLHESHIEIVSPTFMNQRRADDIQFIPKSNIEYTPEINGKSPEELIFDKAIKASEIEKKKEYIQDIDNKIELLKAQIKQQSDKVEIEKLEKKIERFTNYQERIRNNIDDQKSKFE